jgi:hypothetical protein
MTTDFKASQVQTHKVIVTGSFAGGSANQLLIYNKNADDSGSPNQGQIDPTKFSTSGVGSDVFLFVSGGISTRGTPGSYGVAVIGGDLHVSGNLTVDGTSPGGGGGGGNEYWFEKGLDNIHTTGSAEITGSLSQGNGAQASGLYSHAEGGYTTASGQHSHAEGYSTTASGESSHAEGFGTTASGDFSHAEGDQTIASGSYTHAEGFQTLATGSYAHSEGYLTSGSGNWSHSEGEETWAGFKGYQLDILQSPVLRDGNDFIWLLDPVYGDISATISSEFPDLDGRFQTDTGIYNFTAVTYDGTRTVVSGSVIAGVAAPNLFATSVITRWGTFPPTGADVSMGDGSHAEGYSTYALGMHSHSEGSGLGAPVLAIGEGSHGEGHRSIAAGTYSHAEGDSTIASGVGSHAEGVQTKAPGEYSHAEGGNTISYGDSSHAEGYNSKSGWLGYGVIASVSDGSDYAFALDPSYGDITATIGSEFPDGDGNFHTDVGPYAYVNTSYDGSNTYVTGTGAAPTSDSRLTRIDIISGPPTGADESMGFRSHAEGVENIAFGEGSHAEGYETLASGRYSHAEGGSGAGGGLVAFGEYSHAEGYNTRASGYASHAEGYGALASGNYSHAEGESTTASGSYSHAEGFGTTASGSYSHTEGWETTALGDYSHAGGLRTIASGSGQTVFGKYNRRNNTDSLFIIGNGDADGDLNRSDILLINSESLVVSASSITFRSKDGEFLMEAALPNGAGSPQVLFAGYADSIFDPTLYPQISFNGDATTGIWNGAVGQLGFSSETNIVAIFSGSYADFKGTLLASGGLTGSLTKVIDGTSYLIAGSGIQIASNSNGSVTISQAGGGGGGNEYWQSTTANQIFTTASLTQMHQISASDGGQITGSLSVSGTNAQGSTLTLFTGLSYFPDVVTTLPFTASLTDYIIAVSSSNPTAATNYGVELPSSEFGRIFVVKDISGSAAASNITVTAAGSTTLQRSIDGASSYIISINRGSAAFVYFGDTRGWGVI